MAKVTAKPVPALPNVVIELTADEATTLFTILAKIGGSPQKSRRGHIQSIYFDLEKLGFKEVNSEVDRSATIYFKDNK